MENSDHTPSNECVKASFQRWPKKGGSRKKNVSLSEDVLASSSREPASQGAAHAVKTDAAAFSCVAVSGAGQDGASHNFSNDEAHVICTG